MWILIIILLIGVFVILEAKRQEKKYGPCDRKGDLMRSGLLELQRHLQADRKVEILIEEEKQVPEQVTSSDPLQDK
jgi:hypothetical protein